MNGPHDKQDEGASAPSATQASSELLREIYDRLGTVDSEAAVNALGNHLLNRLDDHFKNAARVPGRNEGPGTDGNQEAPLPQRLRTSVAAPATQRSAWGFLRSVLSQGAAIQQDYAAGNYAGYEEFAARLDAAAREREKELEAAPSSIQRCNCAPHEFCEVCTPEGWKKDLAPSATPVGYALGADDGRVLIQPDTVDEREDSPVLRRTLAEVSKDEPDDGWKIVPLFASSAPSATQTSSESGCTTKGAKE